MTKLINTSVPNAAVLCCRIAKAIKNNKSAIAYAIKNGLPSIHTIQDAERLLREIKEMAQDNYVSMREMLGKELLTDIINYHP